MSIDIVITWVDNNDSKWLDAYRQYVDDSKDKEMSGKQRFEDLNTLHYIFRGIENFMPWVRKIHLVTADQCPSWLDTTHPKLNIVSHSDIFSNKDHLPTFNACAIEMCFGNIPDLAEKFIYFNDDTFVIQKVEEKRFFERGLPKDFIGFDTLFHDGIFSHMMHSNMQVINDEVSDKKQFIVKNLFKIFKYKYNIKRLIKSFLLISFADIPMFEIYHHPQPLLKSNIEEVIKKYPHIVSETCASRFKEATNLTQYIFRFYHLIKGSFIPYDPKDTLFVGVSNAQDLQYALKKLQDNKKIAFVCFNEKADFEVKDYSRYKQLMEEYLDIILPEKSAFEK